MLLFLTGYPGRSNILVLKGVKSMDLIFAFWWLRYVFQH